MTTSSFLISDFKTGLQRDLQPWLLPSDAFPFLKNAFLYRGIIRKKGGSDLLGRLVSGEDAGSSQAIDGVVLGLVRFEDTSINSETLVGFGFDSTLAAPAQIASSFFNVSNGVFEPIDTTNPLNVWVGDSTNLFWSTNFREFLYVTNYVVGSPSTNTNTNPIRRHDSTFGATPSDWADFQPIIDSAANPNSLRSCLILLPYKNRLLALSTLEGDSSGAGSYVENPQRLRWSNAEDPTDATVGWNKDARQGAGFKDAPTGERIISAGFIKDILVVYFERSTWKITYRVDKENPFSWERIDAEFGSESTFSLTLFDEGAVGIGYNGIFQTSALGTQRIDLKIPDQVFGFRNAPDAVKQIVGIRDFFGQAIYFAYADLQTPQAEPSFNNRILYFNYYEKSWAIMEGSYSSFGYYNEATDPDSPTWGSLSTDPDDLWSNLHVLWGSAPLQRNFPVVVAGNQKGFVHKIFWGDPFATSRREAVMFNTALISNANPAVVTVTNHNLQDNQYVRFSNFVGVPADWETALTDTIFQVKRLVGGDTFSLQTISFNNDPDGDWVDFDSTGLTNPWTGTADISQVMDFLVQTKRINPAIQDGMQIRLVYNDLYLSTSNNSEDSEINMEIQVDNNSEVIQSENISIFNSQQEKIWKRVFLNAIGTFFTLTIQMNPRQIANEELLDQLVNIHALDIKTRPVGGRVTQ